MKHCVSLVINSSFNSKRSRDVYSSHYRHSYAIIWLERAGLIEPSGVQLQNFKRKLSERSLKITRRHQSNFPPLLKREHTKNLFWGRKMAGKFNQVKLCHSLLFPASAAAVEKVKDFRVVAFSWMSHGKKKKSQFNYLWISINIHVLKIYKFQIIWSKSEL